MKREYRASGDTYKARYDGKRYVAVDRYDKQRVDHYEWEAE